MGSERFPRELAAQLRQDMTFSLHASPDVRVKQVIEATISAVSLKNLRIVRPAGYGKFFITVHTAAAVETLRALGSLTLAGKTFPLVSLSSTMKVITLLNLPGELSDECVLQAMSQYGRVVKLHRETYRDFPTIETGARKILIEVRQEVPNFLSIRGYQATALYTGMKKLCRRCGLQGHFAAECITPRCRRCGGYGHEAASCEEKCRRCGADHWTSRCRVATYASVTQNVDDKQDSPRQELETSLEDRPTPEEAEVTVSAIADPVDMQPKESTPLDMSLSRKEGNTVAAIAEPEEPAKSTTEPSSVPENLSKDSNPRTSPSTGSTSAKSEDALRDQANISTSDWSTSCDEGEVMGRFESMPVLQPKRPHPSGSNDSVQVQGYHQFPGQVGAVANLSIPSMERKKPKPDL